MVKINQSVSPVVYISQPNVPGPSHSTKEVRNGGKLCVQRIEDQTEMFQIIQKTEGAEEKNIPLRINTISDSNITTACNIIKSALNMNYLVILSCLLVTFRSIMSIYYHDCDQVNGDCDTFLKYHRRSIPLHIANVGLGLSVFFYKMKYNNNA